MSFKPLLWFYSTFSSLSHLQLYTSRSTQSILLTCISKLFYKTCVTYSIHLISQSLPETFIQASALFISIMFAVRLVKLQYRLQLPCMWACCVRREVIPQSKNQKKISFTASLNYSYTHSMRNFNVFLETCTGTVQHCYIPSH